MSIFFWFILIVFVSWLLIIYVVPFLLKYYLKRLAKRMENHAEQATRSQKKEGSVNIDYIPENKDGKEAPGDYVDFEEIKEK